MVKAAFLVGTLAGVLAACSPFGGASVFNCEQDSQCAPSGSCKQPEGLCVFPSGTCASGQEYGQHSGSMSGKCVGDDVMVDAAIDAPTMCVPNAKTCFNHAIETCKATGDGFEPTAKEQCAITCADGATTCSTAVASNIPVADQQACHATGAALALSPAAGATVTIAQTEITCAPACNAGGTTTIPRTSTTPNNFFCLAAINIPTGVTVNVTATGATTLFSHGAVVINTNVSFDGGDATGLLAGGDPDDDLPGRGGPGGFIGGALSNDNAAGRAGLGPCTGGAGGSVSTGANAAGGGGGGGGHVGTGGAGGNGLNPTGATATGGTAGVNTGCSNAEARPLVGGSGGSGGGDGSCGAGIACGWPGGGGGGALHIVSRSMISGTGTLTASGGDGFGEVTEQGGGGGGGAGGTLLLEAPAVSFAGPLQVTGGTGGVSNPGNNAGTGAAAANLNGGPGGAAQANNRGGAGGGGGGGRIRINGNGAACPAGVTPTASCTAGALRTSP